MAKITIVGKAAVISSSMKLKDLETIQKYRRDALTLKGGEDGKEPIFAIGVGEGAGVISKTGAYFTEETNTEEKLACITMTLGCVDGDVREVLADKLGSAMMSLNKLEATLPAILDEIAIEKAHIMESIEIAQ